MGGIKIWLEESIGGIFPGGGNEQIFGWWRGFSCSRENPGVMEIILGNYDIFMAHTESLSQADSQALEQAEIEALAIKWLQWQYPMHLAMFLNLLTPTQVLSLTTWQEVHDPVNTIKKINDFTWTIVKLKILTGNSHDESSKQLINFTKFLKEVTLLDSGEYKYQGVTLQNYQTSLNAYLSNYKFFSKIKESVVGWFSELQNSPLFTSLPILYWKKWPQTNEQLTKFVDDKIKALKVYLMPFVEKKKNTKEIGNIMFDWDNLKVEINSFLKNEEDYISILGKVFSETIKNE